MVVLKKRIQRQVDLKRVGRSLIIELSPESNEDFAKLTIREKGRRYKLSMPILGLYRLLISEGGKPEKKK